MKTIRCSELPRIMSCPASLDVGEIEIRSGGKNASIGTAVHEVMADIIRAGDLRMPELYPYADSNGCEVSDVSFMCWRGLDVWKNYAPVLKNVSVEEALKYHFDDDEILLTGHPDVTANIDGGIGENFAVVIDWKTGVDRSHREQLLGYAVCKWRCDVKLITVNLRENVIDTIDVTGKEITDFRDEIQDVLTMEKKPYNPNSENCQYCPRRADCPAVRKMAESSALALAPAAETGITNRERLASLYDQSKILERALEGYRDSLKASIFNDGDLPLPDGRVVTLETSKRQTVTANKDFFEAAAYAINPDVSMVDIIGIIGESAFTVKKSAAIKAVRAASARGKKDGAEIKFMEELEHAGCVKTTEFDKIVCRKAE